MTDDRKELIELFEEHQGLVIHKFPHHIKIYDKLFRERRDWIKGITLVEIGIAAGGSMQLWREYFGERAAIIGIDIQDAAAKEIGSAARIIQGDQGKHDFWNMAKPQLGRPDIIIDDGSHVCADQLVTFAHLFPILEDGGLYIVEDIHTSYRETYGGGLGHPGSFVEFVKRAIDGIHSSEHGGSADSHLFSVQVYPNLAVFEKRSPSDWGGSTMRPA